MSDSGEDLETKIRRVADEFHKYIGPDGRVNATALVDEIRRLRDALEQAQKQAVIDNQEKISAVVHITRLEAALDIYEGIVANSRGVDGWHLNGDIAEWDEFELPEIEKSVLTAGDSGL